MPRLKNFIVDFQKDHSDLFKLVGSFSKAVKSRNLTQGKEILNKIDSIANGHFLFEETYLYPRLRRLVFEITENLRREQQIMKDFIVKSRDALDKNNKLSKNESASILSSLPRLSKFFENCNDLVFLTERFNKVDKDELNIRFKECHQIEV